MTALSKSFRKSYLMPQSQFVIHLRLIQLKSFSNEPCIQLKVEKMSVCLLQKIFYYPVLKIISLFKN